MTIASSRKNVYDVKTPVGSFINLDSLKKHSYSGGFFTSQFIVVIVMLLVKKQIKATTFWKTDLNHNCHAQCHDVTVSDSIEGGGINWEKTSRKIDPSRQGTRKLEKFESAAFVLWLGLPSTLTRHEKGAFRKHSSNRGNFKTAFRFRVHGKTF